MANPLCHWDLMVEVEVEVEDVSQTLRTVIEAGGTVVVSKTPIGILQPKKAGVP